MIRDTVPRAHDHHPRSPCYDDLRFISGNSAVGEEAKKVCATCTFRACQPVLAEILANPTSAAHLEGTWDGEFYSEKRNEKRRLDEANRPTYCHRGHELNEANAYKDARGRHSCRMCGREARKRYVERQKGDAA